MASSVGSFDDSIVLNLTAHNASGYRQDLVLTLLLHADVVAATTVSEPPAAALLLAALALLYAIARNRRIRVRAR
jgi:hypothetical protein